MASSENSQATILVVEDDFSIRETLVEVLELVDYKVVTASNGKEGIEKLQQGLKPCLVLLDMMMPVMGGREFLNKMSEDAVLSPIPVVVVSATANCDELEGAKCFMKKPVDLNQLLRTVEENSLPH
jgi:two-component system chemotaxis response regulator CheY